MSKAGRLPAINESEWQDTVSALARLNGWSLYHTFDSRRSVAGWPDLVIVRPPEALFVELKTDRGRLTVEQQQWLDQLDACGFETHVWRPRDADYVVERLRRRSP